MEELRKLIKDLRTDYVRGKIGDGFLVSDPFQQFGVWFDAVVKVNVLDANAMTLSTVNAEQKPASRIVLLKDFSSEGFTFFTNYNSSKAGNIERNPNVSLLFFWPQFEQQVRIDGIAEKLSPEDSDAYFASRPRESQLGAWASPQSDVLESKKELLNRLEAVIQKYENCEVPRPPHWGGYVVKPNRFEFWQGGAGRLHDRFRYQLNEKNEWLVNRLAP